VQITGFVTLAMVHFGLVSGYGNEDAGATESVIALALFVAFLLTWRSPPRHRRAATAVVVGLVATRRGHLGGAGTRNDP
jgi:hypothetical protein